MRKQTWSYFRVVVTFSFWLQFWSQCNDIQKYLVFLPCYLKFHLERQRGLWDGVGRGGMMSFSRVWHPKLCHCQSDSSRPGGSAWIQLTVVVFQWLGLDSQLGTIFLSHFADSLPSITSHSCIPHCDPFQTHYLCRPGRWCRNSGVGRSN